MNRVAHTVSMLSQRWGMSRETCAECGHVGRWDVVEPGVPWDRLMQHKNKALDRLHGVYMKLLNNAGVQYIEGRGTLVDAHTVEVAGKQYTVRHRLRSPKRKVVRGPTADPVNTEGWPAGLKLSAQSNRL